MDPENLGSSESPLEGELLKQLQSIHAEEVNLFPSKSGLSTDPRAANHTKGCNFLTLMMDGGSLPRFISRTLSSKPLALVGVV